MSRKTAKDKSLILGMSGRQAVRSAVSLHPERTEVGSSYNKAVAEIARRFGVVVGSLEVERRPLSMTPEQAAKIAKDAGIITEEGELAALYK